MILASIKIIPPKEWSHNPTITDNYGFTVAHILAQKCIIPPE